MAKILRSLTLLFAGALASVLGGLLFQSTVIDIRIWILVAMVIVLILYGSGSISKMWHNFNLWKRRGNTLIAPKVGIFNDMRWDLEDNEIRTYVDISPEERKKNIERCAKENKIKIRVKLIDVKKNFDSYTVILNPYGGVYPEHNFKNFETMNKILNYVNEGGIFVNIADIPCYWAYNPLLKRKLDTTPAFYGTVNKNGQMIIMPIRTFERTPLMENLGLKIISTENHPLFNWNVELEEKFKMISQDIGEINVHRVAIVERNVEPIIKPRRLNQENKITPFFLVNYGNGKFLISLLFENNTDNRKIKKVIPKVIIKLIKKKIKNN